LAQISLSLLSGTTRKTGLFPHQKDSKSTFFCNHHTCRGGCSLCVVTVILDQSYYFTQAGCRHHVVLLEVNFCTATITLIMGECQK
jgi:hypothetical protein